jgi:hypothetical protein
MFRGDTYDYSHDVAYPFWFSYVSSPRSNMENHGELEIKRCFRTFNYVHVVHPFLVVQCAPLPELEGFMLIRFFDWSQES